MTDHSRFIQPPSDEIIRISRNGINRVWLVLAFCAMVIFGTLLISIHYIRFTQGDIKPWFFYFIVTLIIILVGAIIWIILYVWIYIPSSLLILCPDLLTVINTNNNRIINNIVIDEQITVTAIHNPQTGDLFGLNIISSGDTLKINKLYRWEINDIERLLHELSHIVKISEKLDNTPQNEVSN